jgi:acyl-CoA hydrolase
MIVTSAGQTIVADPTAEARPAPRTVSESMSEMTELILPNDTNTLGNLLGGRLMHFIDLVGAMAAYRHSRTHVVTAAMDHIDFIQPVHVGDLLILKSSVNRAFSKSVEVGVKVWAENTQAGEYRHVASAYLVFVAIDKDGNPVRVSCGDTRGRCAAAATGRLNPSGGSGPSWPRRGREACGQARDE